MALEEERGGFQIRLRGPSIGEWRWDVSYSSNSAHGLGQPRISWVDLIQVDVIRAGNVKGKKCKGWKIRKSKFLKLNQFIATIGSPHLLVWQGMPHIWHQIFGQLFSCPNFYVWHVMCHKGQEKIVQSSSFFFLGLVGRRGGHSLKTS